MSIAPVFLYANAMIDDTRLARAAYKAEHASSRKLATHTHISLEDALRATLERVAGAEGLAHLIEMREAVHAAQARRRAQRIENQMQAREKRLHKHAGPATPWRAWFDGSAHPNPGRCGIGALLTGPAGESVEISQAAGYGNSSEAEYRALNAVLAVAVRCGARGLTIYGDSQGVIEDVMAVTTRPAPSLAPLRSEALALLAQIEDVTLRWIPRHRNQAADALSQRAVRAIELEPKA